MSKHWQVKQVTRSDFTHEEITNALIKCGNHLSSAAKELSKLGKGKVSRQLLRYWVNSEDFAEEVKSPHYEAEQHIAKVRAQNNAKSLRRQVKQLSEVALVQQEWEETIRRSVKSIVKDLNEPTFEWVTTPESSKNITVEILISDLQIGKLTSYYNTGVALRRLTEVGVKARQAIKQKQELGYNVERIVLAFLGDIIESDEKHADSARACDSSTSEQMSYVIRGIYERVIRNVVDLSPRVDCIGVGGNHDHNGHGMRSFKAGRTMLSYPIYTALKMLCEVQHPNVTWKIPEGVFHIDNIYGENVLYEHGVGVSVTEAAMKKRKTDRGEQIQEHIFYFRMG